MRAHSEQREKIRQLLLCWSTVAELDSLCTNTNYFIFLISISIWLVTQHSLVIFHLAHSSLPASRAQFHSRIDTTFPLTRLPTSIIHWFTLRTRWFSLDLLPVLKPVHSTMHSSSPLSLLSLTTGEHRSSNFRLSSFFSPSLFFPIRAAAPVNAELLIVLEDSISGDYFLRSSFTLVKQNRRISSCLVAVTESSWIHKTNRDRRTSLSPSVLRSLSSHVPFSHSFIDSFFTHTISPTQEEPHHASDGFLL